MNGAVSLTLSALDARVLRATDARYERSPEKVGELAGCAAEVALSTLRPVPWRGPRRGRRLSPAAVASHVSRRCCAGAPVVSGTWEGGCSLSANLLQADVCFGAQRVERSPVACAPAAADGGIVGPGADVTRGAAAEGQDLLERGVPVSAGGAARSVLVSGDLHRWPQPHGLCAGGGGGGRRAACRAHAAQRGAAGGDLAGQPRAAQAQVAAVMSGGCRRRRGGLCGGEHARRGACGDCRC